MTVPIRVVSIGEAGENANGVARWHGHDGDVYPLSQASAESETECAERGHPSYDPSGALWKPPRGVRVYRNWRGSYFDG